MIEAQSEHGHRTVSVFLAFHRLLGSQKLARDAGPDEGGRHAGKRGRHALRLRQTCVFQVELRSCTSYRTMNSRAGREIPRFS